MAKWGVEEMTPWRNAIFAGLIPCFIVEAGVGRDMIDRWIGIAGLFIAAIAMAGQYRYPKAPKIIVDMVIFAGGILGGLLILPLVWSGESNNVSDAKGFKRWPNPYAPIAVINQSFENQTVPLDGYSYNDCTFKNVTFTYNGTTAPQISGSSFDHVLLHTDNPAVVGTMVVAEGIGMLRPNVHLPQGPGSILEPPTAVSPGSQ